MEKLATLTDIELVDMMKSGSQPAFTILYNKYWRLVYGHVFRMLKDEESAKDIVQDLFSSIWLKAEAIPEQVNFAAYLYVAARRKVINAIRHHKHRDAYLEELIRVSQDVGETTLHQLEENELMQRINAEIALLPPRMRQVFELSRKEHLTHKQIGDLLGTSTETVKKQINKSLKVIRHNLKDLGGTAMLLLIFGR